MSRLEQIEIERLVGEIAEEGTSAERIARLSTLLKDNDALQLHYAKVMALHTMLAYELNLSLQAFSPLVEVGARENDVANCHSLSEEIARDLGLPNGRGPRRRGPSLLAVGLALTSIAAAVAFAMFAWPDADAPRELALSPEGRESRAWSQTDVQRVIGSLSEGKRELILTDESNLKEFSRVTKTTPLASMVLPICSAKEFPASLSFCSGTVWMERSTGQKSRGYMVPVRSGSSIELYVEAASSSQNALSVVEIDKYGRISGSAIHFSNLGSEGRSSRNSYKNIGGPLGNWSQRNDTSQTKYYLFTGTHSLRTRGSAALSAPSELQYVSDYRVLLDLPDLIYIGWDDSGYATDTDGERRDNLADYDFDDIAALVRIVDSQPQYVSPTLEYEPQPEPTDETIVCNEWCFPFVVEPGQRAVLLACADAYLSNSLDVIEASTGRPLWRLESLQPPPGVRYTAETEAYHIHNGSKEPAVYYLRGMHQEYDSMSQSTPWVPSRYRELERTDENVIVGFEDSNEPVTTDWNDVQVQIRYIPLEQ